MVRLVGVVTLLALASGWAPLVSAGHGASETTGLTQQHGVIVALLGVGVLGSAVVLKRRDRLDPTRALYGVFVGIAVTALGAILFSAASPEPTFTAETMPIPRGAFPFLALSFGLLITILSVIVGWIRWRTRPRYTYFGILMGVWIAYPYLIPGRASDTHPIGYALVLVTPLVVGYLLWKDVGQAIRTALRDPVSRRFGIGIGLVVVLFFFAVTGYLSFVEEPGVPHESEIVVLSAMYQLVQWPVLEIYLTDVPIVPVFFLALSPGHLIVTGLLGALVGLNATLVAQYWRAGARRGMKEETAGTAAIVGACTCGCCGPLVSKVAVAVAAPSVAAPLYWLFVDPASPLSSLSIVASIVLFAGSIIYSLETPRARGLFAAQ